MAGRLHPLVLVVNAPFRLVSMAGTSFLTAVNAFDKDSQRGLILGIESSCDETAAAVVERGVTTRSSIVASQLSLHAPYGGVVPELASREHLRNMVPVVRSALADAKVTFEDIDAIAVTVGPGLAGALLVGLTYAKATASARNLPLVGINHLEGHIHSVLLGQTSDEDSPGNVTGRKLPLPAVALVVSGGHTHLFKIAEDLDIQGFWRYQVIGRTLDDAAGEAIDKVAKLLGLGYPGGPWIDRLAKFGDPTAIPFALGHIKPKPHLAGRNANVKASVTSPVTSLDRNLLFSFSGIKTAVLRYVELHGMRKSCAAREDVLARIGLVDTDRALSLCDRQTLDLIASFQRAVVTDLVRKTCLAASIADARSIVVTGGVAANSELRSAFLAQARLLGVEVVFPSPALSTDNAAMIAAAAWPRLLRNDFTPMDAEIFPRLALA